MKNVMTLAFSVLALTVMTNQAGAGPTPSPLPELSLKKCTLLSYDSNGKEISADLVKVSSNELATVYKASAGDATAYVKLIRIVGDSNATPYVTAQANLEVGKQAAAGMNLNFPRPGDSFNLEGPFL